MPSCLLPRRSRGEVEKFLEVRRDKSFARFDFRIKRRGLEDSESSWEPVNQVGADMSVPLKKFLKQRAGDTVANEMLKYIGWKKNISKVNPSWRGKCCM